MGKRESYGQGCGWEEAEVRESGEEVEVADRDVDRR